MCNYPALTLCLGLGVFNATATFGQSLELRPRVTELWAAPSITLFPDSVSPFIQGSGRRANPAVARGARIGFAVGAVVGAVYAGTRSCNELACLGKWVFGVPVVAVMTGFLGAMIGAGIGSIASGGANSAPVRTDPVPHLRLGVTLSF